jgi:hypothetical protein
MKNEHLRSALSAKAKERANHFSWNVFTEKVMNVTKALRKKPDISLKKVDELDY